jgi:hypothetical protein
VSARCDFRARCETQSYGVRREEPRGDRRLRGGMLRARVERARFGRQRGVAAIRRGVEELQPRNGGKEGVGTQNAADTKEVEAQANI